MKDNKYRLIELFLYVIIVVVGLVFLVSSRTGQGGGGGVEPPPSMEAISVEGSESLVILSDEQ